MGLRVGIDTGGTFTDFIFERDGFWHAFKLPSTPADPARAVLEGLAMLGEVSEVILGSTVATNAVLQGQGARTAFVTTRGFKDLLALGRQARPSLYELNPPARPRLIPSRLCFEVDERVGADGGVVRALSEESVRRLARRLGASRAKGVAVCLLYSFLAPEHEEAVGAAVAAMGLPVSLSHQVLPRHREYERAVATVLNASLVPLMADYLTRLAAALPAVELSIMQSSGGSARPDHAARFPVHTLLSGPAGGVVAASWLGREAELGPVITLDMGGTSTDVATIEGDLRTTADSSIGGWPMPVPALDIHTVGAGGGSIAFRDRGGALQVGPRSAGAEPGPACYGRGEQPTVTDAHLVLGWLDPDGMAGGRVHPSTDLARQAVARLGRQLGLDELRTAEGIVRLAETRMAGALWRITCERGRDPRHFTLVAFGGAGPLHACALAERLTIPRVVVPPAPGAFSAFGMLAGDRVCESNQGLARRSHRPTGEELDRALATLAARNGAELGLGTGRAPDETARLELRYEGQSHELSVPLETGGPGADTRLAASIELFHEEHRRLYGHAAPERPVELVTVSLRSRVAAPAPGLPAASARTAAEPWAWRSIVCGAPYEAPFYRRSHLAAGQIVEGPAVVVEETATTLVLPDWTARVDLLGCLVMEPRGATLTHGGIYGP